MTSTRTTPYRVSIYGVGDVGGICIREATRLPEFEVVAALVFSDEKAGKDIGELVAIEPLGIKATKDMKEFLAVDCDCVVHVGVDSPEVNALDQFREILEAGKNIVTSHPYSFLPARDASFSENLKRACEKGNATFYAAGLNPDLMTQRTVPLMTSMSNDITEIRLEEYFDCQDQKNRTTLEVIGLGSPLDKAKDENGPAVWYQRQYNYQIIKHLCYEFGIEDVRLGGAVEVLPAPTDIHREVMHIKKGDCASISYISAGYMGDSEKPFISVKITYYFSPEMRPKKLAKDDVYLIYIEGRPSTKLVLGMLPSNNNPDAKQCDGEPAPPAYIAFANTIIQSIPITVESPPGFRAPDVPLVHWKKDLRKNVGKRYTE